MPRGFGGVGMLAIQGLFAPKLSTPDRRLRADFALTIREFRNAMRSSLAL